MRILVEFDILERLHALLERVRVTRHSRHVLPSVLVVLRFQVGIWILLTVGTHLILLAVVVCMRVCIWFGVVWILQLDILVLAIEVDGAHLRERASLAWIPRVLKPILNFFFSSVSLSHRQGL